MRNGFVSKVFFALLSLVMISGLIAGCKPSPIQIQKAVEDYLDKNLEKKLQEISRKRNPPELPLEDRIKAAIPVDLNNAPVKGDAGAPITMVIFSDFQCPFCKRVVPTLDEIMKAYPGKVKFAFRQNPLPMHKNAMSAAKASLAANEQGKFWQMHDAMFENQADVATDQGIEKIAQKIGLNMAKFKADWKSNKYEAQINKDIEFTRSSGATGTPAFFLNGVALKGARPFASFKEVIDKLLEKAP